MITTHMIGYTGGNGLSRVPLDQKTLVVFTGGKLGGRFVSDFQKDGFEAIVFTNSYFLEKEDTITRALRAKKLVSEILAAGVTLKTVVYGGL